MTSFAVLTPSRGLVHSRTIEAVQVNVEQAVSAGHDFRGWRLTHSLPIPDCHERVTEMGLETGADALWYLEEDMIPPAGALLASLELLAHTPIVCVDYPVGFPKGWHDPNTGSTSPGTFNCVPRPRNGAIEWCPLGCTLIARRVFEGLSRPWFDTGKQFITWHFGNVKTIREEIDAPWPYGGQDIWFGYRAVTAGFTIAVVPDMVAGHAMLKEWGPFQKNDGHHVVEIREQIERVV